MASISKRRYWVDPKTKKEVPAGTPGAELRQSRYWRIRYVDAAGRIQSAKGYIDLRATNQLAARLEAAAARGEEKMVNVYSEHDKRSILEHVADYLQDRKIHGLDDEDSQIIYYRLKRVIKDCKWTRLRDVTSESFDNWRRSRYRTDDSDEDKTRVSGKTLNHFKDTLRTFLNWCASPTRKRLAVNPIAGMEKLPHTPTFLRRALQPEELQALYNAAPEERFRVYVFAVTTGLRRTEIADLQWSDVALDSPQPFLQLRDYATKARRSDVFALKPEIAAMLREIRPAGFEADDKVFPLVPEVSVLIDDLKAAKVALPDEDSIDRIDFHALRTTLGSFIGRSGIPERVGMELMRVTDPKLLRRTYCDPRILQTAEAAAELEMPTARRPRNTAQPAVMTGTDAIPLTADDHPASNRVRNRTRKAVGHRRAMAVIGGMTFTASVGQTLEITVSGVALAATVGHCRDDEKMDRVGLEPTTDTPDFPAIFKFPVQSGQKSDNGQEIPEKTSSDVHPCASPPHSPSSSPNPPPNPPATSPLATSATSPESLKLGELEAIWHSLPPHARESILALAKSAAQS